jgi:cytochrome c-type biogenesis protein CcmH/NrfG
MMGWVAMLLLVGAVVLGMWRWFRRDIGAIQFLAAGLLLALAGYAWQGEPGLAGAPKDREQARRPPSEFSLLRRSILGEFDSAGSWLTVAEARASNGNTEGAISVLNDRLEQTPGDMDLWMGLADMLIQHAGGRITPAAQMAFERAVQVAPNHPAPRFFYGLALARGGNFDAAEALWQQALTVPEVQADERWRNLFSRAREIVAETRASPGASSSR